MFSEIKTCLFSHVTQNVLRKFANQIFSHLHSLDSDFHWQTASGTISVAYVRAIRGFQTILFQLVFTVAPTALELYLVSSILKNRCGPVFAGITLTTFFLYTLFTVWITEWRVKLRQDLVDVDNERNGFFIDSILNHEVVKLFTSEKSELARFDGYLGKIQDLNIQVTAYCCFELFGLLGICTEHVRHRRTEPRSSIALLPRAHRHVVDRPQKGGDGGDVSGRPGGRQRTSSAASGALQLHRLHISGDASGVCGHGVHETYVAAHTVLYCGAHRRRFH